MKRKSQSTYLLALVPALVLVSGCVNLKPQENITRFYVLGAQDMSAAGAAVEDSSGLSIGLRRLKLASYLDTPRIVVRLGSNEVRFSETHRWGEDLGNAIGRTVALLIERDPLIGRADAAPWLVGVHHDYLIQIQITNFEGILDEVGSDENVQVHLTAGWEIFDPVSREMVSEGVTDEFLEATSSELYGGIVTGLDEALARLSDDLIAALKAL